MEQQSNESLFGLEIDETVSGYFKDASKWARFVSIVGFIFLGIMFLSLIIGSATAVRSFNLYYSGNRLNQNSSGASLAVVAILLIACTFLFIFIIRSATFIKRGIDRQDQSLFNEGLKSMKNGFMLHGILIIVWIAFNLIQAFFI